MEKVSKQIDCQIATGHSHPLSPIMQGFDKGVDDGKHLLPPSELLTLCPSSSSPRRNRSHPYVSSPRRRRRTQVDINGDEGGAGAAGAQGGALAVSSAPLTLGLAVTLGAAAGALLAVGVLKSKR